MTTGAAHESLTVIELGSGEMTAAGIAPKAARLDEAKKNGLDVPEGAVVPDGVAAEDAARALTVLFQVPLVVRSAFSAEDTEGQSMAGHFDTELDIAPRLANISAAIERVRASGSPEFRRDVLVMPMVNAERAGVVFSEPGWEDDVVNVVAGQGDLLVSGIESGDRIEMPRIGRWEPSSLDEPWMRRLQALLRDLRNVEGDLPWDIEWADDGTACWLLQIRPITAPITRDELFTLANHREILPDPPSVLMSSIIMKNGTRIGGPGGLMASTVQKRPYFEMFDGRPYINQSVTTDFLRSLGLPSSLVNDSLGGDDVDASSVNPLRIVRSAPKFARLGAGQATAVSRADAVASQLENPDLSHATTFEAALKAIADDHVALVDEMGNLVSVMAVPLSILRKAGVLAEHFSGLETPGTRIMSDLRAFAEAAAATPGALEQLEAGEVPTEPALAEMWADWLSEHGHRGRFESDISQPRFVDDTASTLRLAGGLAAASAAPPESDKSAAVIATTPLWVFARRALVAREELRTRAMRGFHQHRLNLLELATGAVSRGQLPDVEAIWDLSSDELIALDAGEVVTTEQLHTRRAEVAAHAAIDVPELRRRFGAVSDSAVADGSGVPLFPGRVEGVAWVLNEPSTEPPADFDPATTVLVARSVDAGWVPTFGLVAGVAVDIGGDLSHGSIILRELAIPSITNTRGLTKELETGDAVTLDATAGVLSTRSRGLEEG